MGYVNVKEETEDKLHFIREPSNRSWAIFIGLISLGLGAAYYSGDYLVWKIAYVSGSVFVGLTCMEDWEECILDKASRRVIIKKISLIQKMFRAEQGQKIVVGDLDDCVSVSVQEEEVKYAGAGHIVVLQFATGYSLGVTETAAIEDKTDQEYVAEKIRHFLGLDENAPMKQAPYVEPDDSLEAQEVGAAAATATEPTNNMDTLSGGSTAAAEISDNIPTDESDDSFEQIDTAELTSMNETKEVMENNELLEAEKQDDSEK